MRTLRARSVSLPVLPLFDAVAREGIGFGHGYIDLGDRVIAITPCGAPRMPNGIECDVSVPRGVRVRLGSGRLVVGDEVVAPGPAWDPVPTPRVRIAIDVAFIPDPILLAGRGPGLTPAGDDLLAGYAAGLVLFAGRVDQARLIAERAAPRTTLLSATLLRHAARGELPEPAHAFLEHGDPFPLLGFGHTSGTGLLLGLALASRAAPPPAPGPPSAQGLAGRGREWLAEIWRSR